MSVWPFKQVMKDGVEMKISKEDATRIITKHFSDHMRECVNIKPFPIRNPTHYVLEFKEKTDDTTR